MASWPFDASLATWMPACPEMLSGFFHPTSGRFHNSEMGRFANRPYPARPEHRLTSSPILNQEFELYNIKMMVGRFAFTFSDSRGVTKKILVADLQYGIAITWRGMRLSYTHVLRTKEFER